MAYTEEVKFTKTNQYGGGLDEDDVYTVQEFKDCCEDGGFIDYDGYGHPVRDNKSDNSIYIKPSELQNIPDDATHIVWFNR